MDIDAKRIEQARPARAGKRRGLLARWRARRAASAGRIALAARHCVEALESRTLLTAIDVSGGALNINSPVHLDYLNIGQDGIVFDANSGANTIVTHAISITGNGRLELGNNDLIAFYSDPSVFNTVKGYVLAGKSANLGIRNTNTGTPATAYAVVDNNVTHFNNFDAEPLNNGAGDYNQVLVAYTFAGDVNLDRIVNSQDLAIANAHLNQSGSWVEGDVNLDGIVNSADIAIINGTMNAGVIPQTPFSGTPAPLPGYIEAENFDNGNEGAAYHDADRFNLGNTYRSTGVDIQASSDAGGGYVLAYTRAGEWLKYTVNVTASGTYNFGVRLSNNASGGALHMEVDGTPVTGSITVPNTGSFFSFQTVAGGSAFLSAGQHTLRLFFDANSANGYVGNINAFEFYPNDPVVAKAPFPAVAPNLPATLQAEDFDKGGPGVSYFDIDGTNRGGKYRTTGVDVEQNSDGAGTQYDIGYTAPGEWLEYTINVVSSDYFIADFRLANPAGGGTLHLDADGTNVSGTVTTPNTGSYTAYQTVSTAPFRLTAGVHVLRVTFDSASPSGWAGNFNWLQLRAASTPTVTIAASAQASEQNVQAGVFTVTRSFNLDSPLTVAYTIGGAATNGTDYTTLTGAVIIPAGSATGTIIINPIDDAILEKNGETVVITLSGGAGYSVGAPNSATLTIADNDRAPFNTTPAPIPGLIQAEDFDFGGEGVAYHDFEAANVGNNTSYRAGGVDLENTIDTGGGLNVGFTRPGEWLEYTVNAAASGSYDVNFRAANSLAGGVFHMSIDGVDVTGPLSVPNVGSFFATYGTVTKTGVSIGAGQHIIRITFDTATANGYVGNLNWFQFAGTTTAVIASDPNASEVGPKSGKFTFSRTGSTASALTLHIAISGTATNGVDYNTLPTTVTISAGALTADLLVTPKTDAITEGNETVVVTLLADPSYALGSSVLATVTINESASSISGTVYGDADGSRARDPGEAGLAGYTVYLDANADGALDNGEVSMATGADGAYTFSNPPSGAQTVRLVPPANGFVQTQPAGGAYFVTVSAGVIATGKDFGIYQFASSVDGFLTITGSNLANSISITQGDQVEVGFDGATATFEYGFAQSVTVNAMGGDDQLTLSGPPNVNIIFDGGAGVDTLVQNGSEFGDAIWIDGAQIYYGAGAAFTNTENVTINSGDGDDFVSQLSQPAASFAFNGGGGNDFLSLNSGTYTFNADPGGNLTVAVYDRCVFNTTAHLASIYMAYGSTTTLKQGGGRMLVTQYLQYDPQSTLDLNDNALLIRADSNNRLFLLQNVAILAANARGAENFWANAGLGSSYAASQVLLGQPVGVGYRLNDNGLGGAVYSTYNGEQIDQNTIIVRYTYDGDLNLDGRVDADDVSLLLAGFNNFGAPTSWISGDLNYDYQLNADDVSLLIAGLQSAQALGALPAP